MAAIIPHHEQESFRDLQGIRPVPRIRACARKIRLFQLLPVHKNSAVQDIHRLSAGGHDPLDQPLTQAVLF